LNQQVGRLLALENATVGWLRFASPKVDTASAAVFPVGLSSWFRDLWRRLDLVFPYTIFNLATAFPSVTENFGNPPRGSGYFGSAATAHHSYLRRGLLPQRWQHYFARNASVAENLI
jgi:hypothetical protein